MIFQNNFNSLVNTTIWQALTDINKLSEITHFYCQEIVYESVIYEIIIIISIVYSKFSDKSFRTISIIALLVRNRMLSRTLILMFLDIIFISIFNKFNGRKKKLHNLIGLKFRLELNLLVIKEDLTQKTTLSYFQL